MNSKTKSFQNNNCTAQQKKGSEAITKLQKQKSSVFRPSSRLGESRRYSDQSCKIKNPSLKNKIQSKSVELQKNETISLSYSCLPSISSSTAYRKTTILTNQINSQKSSINKKKQQKEKNVEEKCIKIIQESSNNDSLKFQRLCSSVKQKDVQLKKKVSANSSSKNSIGICNNNKNSLFIKKNVNANNNSSDNNNNNNANGNTTSIKKSNNNIKKCRPSSAKKVLPFLFPSLALSFSPEKKRNLKGNSVQLSAATANTYKTSVSSCFSSPSSFVCACCKSCQELENFSLTYPGCCRVSSGGFSEAERKGRLEKGKKEAQNASATRIPSNKHFVSDRSVVSLSLSHAQKRSKGKPNGFSTEALLKSKMEKIHIVPPLPIFLEQQPKSSCEISTHYSCSVKENENESKYGNFDDAYNSSSTRGNDCNYSNSGKFYEDETRKMEDAFAANEKELIKARKQLRLYEQAYTNLVAKLKDILVTFNINYAERVNKCLERKQIEELVLLAKILGIELKLALVENSNSQLLANCDDDNFSLANEEQNNRSITPNRANKETAFEEEGSDHYNSTANYNASFSKSGNSENNSTNTNFNNDCRPSSDPSSFLNLLNSTTLGSSMHSASALSSIPSSCSSINTSALPNNMNFFCELSFLNDNNGFPQSRLSTERTTVETSHEAKARKGSCDKIQNNCSANNNNDILSLAYSSTAGFSTVSSPPSLPTSPSVLFCNFSLKQELHEAKDKENQITSNYKSHTCISNVDTKRSSISESSFSSLTSNLDSYRDIVLSSRLFCNDSSNVASSSSMNFSKRSVFIPSLSMEKAGLGSWLSGDKEPSEYPQGY